MDAKSLVSTDVLRLIAAFRSGRPENHASRQDTGRDAGAEGHPSFETILRLYHKRVYNLAYRLLGDSEDAADLTQETFVKAYGAYGRFHGKPEAVYPWLCRIAVNNCKNRFREMGRRSRYEAFSLDEQIGTEDSALTLEISDESTDPAGLVEQQELEGKIQETIQSLPPEFRVVVVLRDMQGLSYQEIADATGLTMETVKVRLFRGRGVLRRRLGPYLSD